MKIDEPLEDCPYCGNSVYLEKIPLWTGSHGYKGYYEMDIRCHNPDCRCWVYLGQNDTIYRSEEEAKRNAIQHWNRRAAKLKSSFCNEEAVSAMKRLSAMSAKNGNADMTLDEINAEIEGEGVDSDSWR